MKNFLWTAHLDGKGQIETTRRMLNDKKICQRKREERWENIRKKGIRKGCMVGYNGREGVVRRLEKITEDGFLIIEGCKFNRENPAYWDLIIEQSAKIC